MSLMEMDVFLMEMLQVAQEAYRVLKKGKMCDVIRLSFFRVVSIILRDEF